MRKMPTDKSGAKLSPPPVKPRFDQKLIGGKVVPLVTQTRCYELITPLFGGGVKPGEADPVTVIRGPEIRGHLRFWWRACRGGQFNGDLRAMKEAEDLLWGAASTARQSRPSQVEIIVKIKDRGKPFVVRTNDGQEVRISHPTKSPYGYVAFPLNDMLNASVQEGVKFSLTVKYPMHTALLRGTQWDIERIKNEVEAAFWAWEVFGGIGARTRRGFGALRVLSVDSKERAIISNVQDFVRNGLTTHVVQGQWPPGVPHLSRSTEFKITRQFTHANNAPLEAWKYMIRQLKEFRQARHGKFGRSCWPEPELIRRLTGQRLNKGKRVHAPIPPNLDEFPRAAFGLPIIFQFKDSDNQNPNDTNSDPRKTSLQLDDYERLASSLILRSFACSNSAAVGIGLILEGHISLHNLNVVLRTKEGADARWDNQPTRLDVTKAGQILDANGRRLLGTETDVLKAFLRKL